MIVCCAGCTTRRTTGRRARRCSGRNRQHRLCRVLLLIHWGQTTTTQGQRIAYGLRIRMWSMVHWLQLAVQTGMKSTHRSPPHRDSKYWGQWRRRAIGFWTLTWRIIRVLWQQLNPEQRLMCRIMFTIIRASESRINPITCNHFGNREADYAVHEEH